jgi:FkbM family methyltransferase
MIESHTILTEIQHIKNRIKTQGIRFYLKRQWLKLKFRLEGRVVRTINYNNLNIQIILEAKNGLVDLVIYCFGIFGKEFVDLIKKELNQDKVFVDVGANIGQHSLILSNYCKKVISFEPLPSIYHQFRQSIELNGYQNIELHNLGCSNNKETREITIDPVNAGGSTLLFHNNSLSNTKKEMVHLDKLDDILAHQKVDVIKIDVEGYEYFVLLGAEKTLANHKPIIFIEYSPHFYESLETGMSKKLYDLIKKHNYSVYNFQSNRMVYSFDELPMDQIDLILKPL